MEALTETAERTGGALAVHLMADHGLSVTDQVEQHELAEAILDIVLAIAPRARRAFTMRFVEERTPEEGPPTASAAAGTPDLDGATKVKSRFVV